MLCESKIQVVFPRPGLQGFLEILTELQVRAEGSIQHGDGRECPSHARRQAMLQSVDVRVAILRPLPLSPEDSVHRQMHCEWFM